MKKVFLVAAAAVLAVAAAAAVLLWLSLPGWEPEGLSLRQKYSWAAEMRSAAQCVRDSGAADEALPQEDIDAAENALAQAGFAVLDTSESYPEYLSNPESLRTFWEQYSGGQDAHAAVFHVLEDGSLGCMHFWAAGEEQRLYYVRVGWDENGKLCALESESLPIYEMSLTDWDYFYYRTYPKDDPHYIDYVYFRLKSVDQEMYDLCRTYVSPVGYQLVNLFLVDWTEEEPEAVSFNDLFDSLYEREYGEQPSEQDYTWSGDVANIPAALFEQVVAERFAIPLERLRQLAYYDEDTDTYPWRPMFGDDVTAWNWSFCEPEVVQSKENSDGTLTLTVQVYSSEHMTNNLFSHELCVRPMADGSFQYVSNMVTYVGEWGLPPTVSRFSLA